MEDGHELVCLLVLQLVAPRVLDERTSSSTCNCPSSALFGSLRACVVPRCVVRVRPSRIAVNRGGVHLGRKLPVFVCQSLGFLMGPCARALAPGRAMEGQAGTASAPAPPRRSAATA